jgi:hypothetical protein
VKKAIVTLAVGSKYQRNFDVNCRGNWEVYCKKFGYELIVISEQLDASERAQKRSPAWQKLLILSQDWSVQYDRIVWIDSDIIINNGIAPDVSESCPIEKVGAVESGSIPTKEISKIVSERMRRQWEKDGVKFLNNPTPGSYYTSRGIPGGELNEIVQTGVVVSSPRHHREIFQRIYNSYEDTHGAEWNYEMPAMSYELLKAGVVHWLPAPFNHVIGRMLAAFYPEAVKQPTKWQSKIDKYAKKWGFYTVPPRLLAPLRNIYNLSYFLHFAGRGDLFAAAPTLTRKG